MDFKPGTFGALYADTYDAQNDPGTTAQSVALISQLAGRDARILELAIGTGRMAIPLADLGHRIEGIDGSPEMVALMRNRPGGAEIPAVIGDMADVGPELGVNGPFDFAFLVFNTIFNLTSQAAQIRLFANVAALLAPGGRFLIETFVPDFSAYTEHQRMKLRGLDMSSLFFEAVDHDPVEQVLRMQRFRMNAEGATLSPLVMRYAYPPELDLMAQMAGLRRTERWGSWERDPFTKTSKMHVTLYEKPA